MNGKYFGRIAGFPVSSPLLHLPPVVCGSLRQMLSLPACCSTWKSWFLDVSQKPLLPAIKWLKLIYFFLYLNGRQIWTSLYLLQSSSHNLQSHQHPATKDSIRLMPWGPVSHHTQMSHKRDHTLGHCGPRHCCCDTQQRHRSLLGLPPRAGSCPWGRRQWPPAMSSSCRCLSPDMTEARNGTRLKLSIRSGAAADKRQSRGTRVTETSCRELDCISNRM